MPFLAKCLLIPKCLLNSRTSKNGLFRPKTPKIEGFLANKTFLSVQSSSLERSGKFVIKTLSALEKSDHKKGIKSVKSRHFFQKLSNIDMVNFFEMKLSNIGHFFQN